MAILKSLLVNGPSRLLQKLWVPQLEVSNDVICGSLSGGTITGTTVQVGQNGQYFKADSSGTNIPNLTATDAYITNSLHSARWDAQVISQLGGSLYISPTIKFPNAQTIVTAEIINETLRLTITDANISSEMAGAVWTVGSRVKVSGSINGVVTGTMDGDITSINLNASHVMVISNLTGENALSVVPGTYTQAQLSELCVALYQIKSGSFDYRVGIWMNCYDTANESSTIRIYGGSTAAPTLLLGNMTNAGLPQVGGQNPVGYGLFSDNAFLKGVLYATAGSVGGFELSNNVIKTQSVSVGSTARNSIALSSYVNPDREHPEQDGFSRVINGTSRQGLVFAIGGNFGVDGDGSLFVNNADITGKVTATNGTIGGFDITRNYISGRNFFLCPTGELDDIFFPETDDDEEEVECEDFEVYEDYDEHGIYIGTYTDIAFWIGSCSKHFLIRRNGSMKATDAEIKGVISAGSRSKIGPWHVTDTSIYKVNSAWGNGTAGAAYFGDDGISIANQFTVSSTGTLKATSGRICCAADGTGGWEIASNVIRSTATVDGTSRTTGFQSPNYGTWALAIGATSSSSWANAPFRVTHGGQLTATGADILGTIKATAGRIGCDANGTGGWSISSNVILSTATVDGTSRTTGLQVSGSGTWAFAIGATSSSSWANAPFRVTHAGALTATSATITGSVTATSGTIGGCAISNGVLQVGNANITSISADKVTSGTMSAARISGGTLTLGGSNNGNGTLVINNASGATIGRWNNAGLTATSGTIAGWTFNSTTFSKTVTIDNVIYQPFISAPAEPTINSAAFMVRKNTGTSANPVYSYPFIVRYGGSMSATNASITGSITATTLLAHKQIELYLDDYDGYAYRQKVIWQKPSQPEYITVVGIDESNCDIEFWKVEQSASLGDYYSIRVNAKNGVNIYGTGSVQIQNTEKGNLLYRSYANTIRVPTCTTTTDGQRVSGMYTSGTTGFAIQAQWGTTGTAYSTKSVTVSSSDIRLKSNVQDTEVSNALDVIKQIRMRSFDWTDHLEHQKIGFIADEMELIDPKFAIGGGYDDDGNMDIKSVDTFYLMGYMVKAIQELSEKNRQLETRLTALELR